MNKIFKKDIKQSPYDRVFNIIAIITLVILGLGSAPYFFYQGLRWGITILSLYQIRKINNTNDKWFWIYLVIAILFNPIAPFYLSKSIWLVLDLIVALVFFMELKK